MEDSSDGDSDEHYSVHNISDDLHFSSSEDEWFAEGDSQKNEELIKPGPSTVQTKNSIFVKLDNLSVYSFLVVKVEYDKGTKKRTL